MKSETLKSIDYSGVCSLREIPEDCDVLLDALHFRRICPGFRLAARSDEYISKHINTSHDHSLWMLDATRGDSDVVNNLTQNRNHQISVKETTFEGDDEPLLSTLGVFH